MEHTVHNSATAAPEGNLISHKQSAISSILYASKLIWKMGERGAYQHQRLLWNNGSHWLPLLLQAWCEFSK